LCFLVYGIRFALYFARKGKMLPNRITIVSDCAVEKSLCLLFAFNFLVFRYEILNEINRDEVFADVLEWISKLI
jgi:hypothetical protein